MIIDIWHHCYSCFTQCPNWWNNPEYAFSYFRHTLISLPAGKHFRITSMLTLTLSMLTMLFWVHYTCEITAGMTTGPIPPIPMINFDDVLEYGYEVIKQGNISFARPCIWLLRLALLKMPPPSTEEVLYEGAVGTLGGELWATCVCAVGSPLWYNPNEPNPRFPTGKLRALRFCFGLWNSSQQNMQLWKLLRWLIVDFHLILFSQF